MALGWVGHEVELFVDLLEGVRELGRVLHMDVVVHGAVESGVEERGVAGFRISTQCVV